MLYSVSEGVDLKSAFKNAADFLKFKLGLCKIDFKRNNSVFSDPFEQDFPKGIFFLGAQNHIYF